MPFSGQESDMSFCLEVVAILVSLPGTLIEGRPGVPVSRRFHRIVVYE